MPKLAHLQFYRRPEPRREVAAWRGQFSGGKAPVARLLTFCLLGALGLVGDSLWPAPGRETLKPAMTATIAYPILRERSPQQPPGRARRAMLWRVQAAPEFKVQDAEGPAGKDLPLSITLPPNDSGSYGFLMVGGLPEGFNLSSGFRTKDHWVVSLKDAAGVKILPSPTYSGSFSLKVILMRGQESPPERRVITVELRPAAAAGPLQPTAAIPLLDQAAHLRPAPPDVTDRAAPRTMSDDDRSMMERADHLLHEGDVAAARLIYGRLARDGLAAGAVAMARTYDPEFLKTIPRAGLQPDLAQVKRWYRKAGELGDAAAATRLGTLRASDR